MEKRPRPGAWALLRRGILLLLAAFTLLTVLIGSRPRDAAAQAASSGVIAGVVLDQEDRQPLPNARVAIYRSTPADSGWTMVHEGLTDPSGAFRYSVAPGSYRVICYAQSYSVNLKDDVVVAAGATAELSITLTPKPLEIQGIQVQGEQKNNTDTAALTKRKQAAAMTDAISAEQISKSTDANAAEALQRVTGLSVVQGRYVYVRGMGERYSSTQLNGASISTPEPNKRVIPLDLFPSGALDEIVVQKSYTPDQDAEFGGGVIQLRTKDTIEKSTFQQVLSTGYSGTSLQRKGLNYAGGAWDFLGFDDGTRDLPDDVKKLAGNQRIVTGGVFGGGFKPAQIQEMGRSFNKTWSPQPDGARPNYAYSGTYGKNAHLLGKPLNLLGSLSFSNGVANQDRDNNAYAGTSTRLTPLYLYKVEESTMKVLWGALTNASMHLAEGNVLRLQGLYTRSAEDYARIMSGPNFNYGTPEVRVSSLNYVERGLFSGVASGEHLMKPVGGVRLDWRASYSEALRDEPDRRENVYEADGLGGMTLSKRASVPLTRIFGAMNEYDRSLSADLSRLFQLGSESGVRTLKLKAGGILRHKNRLSGFRRLGFKLGRSGADSLDTSLPPEELLVDDNIRPRFFELLEETRENDQYRASQHVLAGYGMIELKPIPQLELMGGVRNERSDQIVEAKSPFVTTAVETEARLINNDMLPSASATFRFTSAMNVRFGYSETVSRPELREMSPFDMYDYETGYSEVGDPHIQSTKIENYDARWELYPGLREILSVSAFRKVLFQPIENIVLGSSGGYVLSPRNGRDGRLRGAELEARLSAARIWSAASRVIPILPDAGTGLNRWGLNLNYSRVESSVRVQNRLDDAGRPVYREGPLQGQSTYSLNAGLYYGTEAMDGSLLLSSFGRRLAQVGAGATQTSLPDIYEYPPVTLDMTLSREISPSVRFKISAENLLDRAVEYRQLDQVTRRYRTGRTLALAMSLRG